MNWSLLSSLGKEGIKKILPMVFSVEMSEQFADCMDIQLTKIFEDSTGIKGKHPMRMGWTQEKGFLYTKDKISKLNAQLYLVYGIVDVWISWQSKSGRIYDINGTDIDCHDIEFAFENLDVDKCWHSYKPNWSLFTIETAKKYLIEAFAKCSIKVSYEFLKCADQQLTALFTKGTGVKPNKNISFTVSENPFSTIKMLEGSKLNLRLYVNHNWNDISFIWQSKSGRVYKTDDTDINCSDIEFSFEKLDTQLYIEQLYPKGQKLPFVLKDLPYELIVNRLNLDCTLQLTVNDDYKESREVIMSKLFEFIDDFNTASEKKDRDEGVIHNIRGDLKNNDSIIFEIYLGSVGFSFFKKLLKFLAKIPGVKKVEID